MRDVMPLLGTDLEITLWPPEPKTGMLTGKIPQGIRAEHMPTGCVVICTKERSQHQNKRLALKYLELLVEA
jgi:protein subunit release factor A